MEEEEGVDERSFKRKRLWSEKYDEFVKLHK